MPLFGILIVAVQIYFAVHCMRTGRSGWLFVILLFPVIGSLVYFFAEYLPELRAGATISNLSKNLASKIDPTAELRRLRDEVEHNNSVGNRVALAEGLVNAGFYDEAIAHYKGCMKGIYEDDRNILAALCRAYSMQGNFEEAEKHLVNFNTTCKDTLSKEMRFLYARTLEQAGKDEEAVKQYASILDESVGEEIRCHYGLLLKKLGRVEEASMVFNEILKNARVSPRFYRRTEKRWINIAKKECSA